MARKSQILGASALDKVLGQLPGEIGEAVLQRALRKGAALIVRAARKRVPVRSGELKRAIAVNKGRRKKAERLLIGFRKPHSRRAHLTEFGTSTQPAQPFIRPAVEEQGQAAIDAIGEALGKEIDKAASKLAGPYAQSGLARRRGRRR